MDFAKRVRELNENIVDFALQKVNSDSNIISLAGGTPPFPIPHSIYDNLFSRIKDNVKFSQYSRDAKGEPELRELIAEHLTNEFGHVVRPDEILITVGANSALFTCLLTFINPNDEVLFFSPGYPGNISQITLTGGKVKYVRFDENNNWEMDFKSLESNITNRSKVIIYSEPCNPTGALFSKESKKRLLKVAKKHNLVIIADETYRQLVYQKKLFRSIRTLKNSDKNIVLIRSFSKDFSMSGFRLGYIYSDNNWVQKFQSVHIAMNICAPTISQEIAKLMFSQKKEVYKRYIKEYEQRRKIMCRRLRKFNNFFSYVKPSGGFSIFVKYHKKMNSMEFFEFLLEKAKVAVMPGIAFGPFGENHFRISFATSIEKINKAFDRIEKLII